MEIEFINKNPVKYRIRKIISGINKGFCFVDIILNGLKYTTQYDDRNNLLEDSIKNGKKLSIKKFYNHSFWGGEKDGIYKMVDTDG